MKKLLSLMLAVVMIASIASIAVTAADLNKVTIKAVSQYVTEGTTTVDVPIVVEYSGNKGLLASEFSVDCIGATITKLTGGRLPGSKVIQDNTMCWVGGSDESGSIPSGTVIATATVTLPRNAADGDEFTVVITPSKVPANFCDTELNDQQGVGKNGTISVSAVLDEVFIKASEVNVAQGSTTVDVPIYVQYDKGLTLSSFKFFIEASAGVVLNGITVNSSAVTQKLTDGNVAFGVKYDNSGDLVSIPSGTLIATATFTLPANAKVGTVYNVNIIPDNDPSNFLNIEEKNQRGFGINGKITVSASFKPGDVDGSNEVNAKDIIKIMRYILNPKNVSGTFIFEAGDVDKSGSLTAKDIILIMRMILRGEV